MQYLPEAIIKTVSAKTEASSFLGIFPKTHLRGKIMSRLLIVESPGKIKKLAPSLVQVGMSRLRWATYDNWQMKAPTILVLLPKMAKLNAATNPER